MHISQPTRHEPISLSTAMLLLFACTTPKFNPAEMKARREGGTEHALVLPEEAFGILLPQPPFAQKSELCLSLLCTNLVMQSDRKKSISRPEPVWTQNTKLANAFRSTVLRPKICTRRPAEGPARGGPILTSTAEPWLLQPSCSLQLVSHQL